MDPIQCEILSSKPQWQGNFLQIDAAEVLLPDGQVVTHEVLRHPGAAAIVALDGKGNVLMEHQYRTPINKVVWEIPAGKLTPGEDPLLCAKRELKEETGYEANSWRYLSSVAVALGYSDEIIHIYVAQDLQAGEQHLDSDEFLATQWMPLQNLVEEIMSGAIEDSKTIIGILMAARLSDL